MVGESRKFKRRMRGAEPINVWQFPSAEPMPECRSNATSGWRFLAGCCLSASVLPGNPRRIFFGRVSWPHGLASGFSGRFPRPEARRLSKRFEWHYTPKHGSWLDMAESELAVLSTQCLDRRIPDKPELIVQVAAWEQRRNSHHAKADWQFTTNDARVKLARLYPQFE